MSSDSEIYYLRSNIDVEYYKWLRYNNHGEPEYRWDLLTGVIYTFGDCSYEMLNKTYFMNNHEYPIYNIYGEYLGFYTKDGFFKPISRRDFIGRYNNSDKVSDPWS